MKKKVVIIGAGPAGLTAAYQLSKAGIASLVLEKDSIVGGIARTVTYKGFHFDIGGHRFFTKVKPVDRLWREILPEGAFLRRQRLSRIYYNNNYFHYPLRAGDTLLKLGIWNSFLILCSYCVAQVRPKMPEVSLQDWVSNRFGTRLYRTFFKTYTEKVWGIPCNEISAEWAAQRIKGLSLISAVKNALWKGRPGKDGVIKTLIDEFDYPKRGPGMMWESATEAIRASGNEVRMGADVTRIHWKPGAVTSIQTTSAQGANKIEGTDFISTMPIRELIDKLDPPAPEAVRRAAQSLNYRDFLTVAIILNKPEAFPDNWIYIHEPTVKVGRIQNFKNWSPFMVPDDGRTCLGLEYFCFEGDGLWNMSDPDLIALGKKELVQLGLVDAADVADGCVVRMPKAYPVYDSTYQKAVETVREFLREMPNLQLVGRNGMHKYNNQDHSMLTAMLAVENIRGANHDLWAVNSDPEYHEEVSESEQAREDARLLASTQPRVPVRHDSQSR